MPTLTLLGTGTSSGVPSLNCDCKVCTSDDPRDFRFRTAAMYQDGSVNILIDCGPDARLQLLKNFRGINKLHGVLITHGHNDHCIGLDELRVYTNTATAEKKHIDIYCDSRANREIMKRFDYCFPKPGKEQYLFAPSFRSTVVNPMEAFKIEGIEIKPLKIMHGKLQITAYKIGNKLGYVTDCSLMPEETVQELYDLDVLVLNALCHTPFYSHQSFEQAYEIIRRIKPKKVFFVHMNHNAGTHKEMQRWIEANPIKDVDLNIGIDGLKVNF